MAEPFVITPSPIIVDSTPTSLGTAMVLDLRLAIDISRWDEIDIQFGLLSIGGVSGSPVLRVDFMTSMTADQEDPSWDMFASAPDSLLYTVASGTPVWQVFPLPTASGTGTGKPLLRYLRWRAWYTTAGTGPSASFVAYGIGRSKGS